MPRIPDEEIERIKRETDLVALVQSRGIKLSKHGSAHWKGLCPFHNDQNTPNLIITPAKGLWRCMTCAKTGNVIQFVEAHDGLSFRHAFELLAHGGKAAYTARPQAKQTTVALLPCPLEPEADDLTLLSQVTSYYHQRLKLSPVALSYLDKRGLNHPDLIDKYQLGFADRSLGLRMPEANRKTGELLRNRLTQLGVWRASGHEHFNGCIVVPLRDSTNRVVTYYGRRIMNGEVNHLYATGQHQGLFNPATFEHEEVILCESVLDALTFCVHGITNVSCLYGARTFTPELVKALQLVKRVKLAYDADPAGEEASIRDIARLQAMGIEVWRIRFPWGMDANEYALKVTPADKSLSLLINAALWCGQAQGKEKVPVGPLNPPTEAAHPTVTRQEPVAEASPEVSSHDVPAPSSSLVANVSSSEEEAAKEKKSGEASELKRVGIPVAPVVAVPVPTLELRADAWFLSLDGREYRVSGLEKTLGGDHLKIGLRVAVDRGAAGTFFHLDQLDLMRDTERRRFIERAAEETGLTPDLLKRDMGRLLLAVETAQAELMKPQKAEASGVILSAEERAEATEWLRAPDLIPRLKKAFRLAGIVGEDNNTLVAYLAGTSRKLDRPLAIIIQSASAAGKTTLMDAVLSFFPEEERVKYSAMTGQSLYYLGQTNLKHKILAIVEEAGAEKASYALKLLQSEGELTIASTGKDPNTGRMVTQEYRVEGPVMIFLTTTAIEIDEELQNRCFILTVNETIAQTQAIHQLQRQRRTLAGLVATEERKDVLVKLRNAQRLLTPCQILNSYAPDLTFPSERTRTRRDHEKYLTLIDSITLLHQYQRPRRQHTVQGRLIEYIEVSLDDIALANELAPEVLGRSLDELPPQTRRLLEYIRALVKKQEQAPGVSIKSGHATFSRRELKDLCGWSLTQVRLHLERLVELEYLALRCSRLGSSFLYELLIAVDSPENVAHIGLIDVEKLREIYGYNPEVAGKTGGVTGGSKTATATLNPLEINDLNGGWRGNGHAHQEASTRAVVA